MSFHIPKITGGQNEKQNQFTSNPFLNASRMLGDKRNGNMENVQEELKVHLKNTVILRGMEAFDDSKPILTQCTQVLKKARVELTSGH